MVKAKPIVRRRPRRGQPVEIAAPIAMPEGTLAQQANAVLQAAADGDLAPAQAAQIVNALGGVAKIVETTKLVRRIESLEERSAAARGAPLAS